MGNLATFVLFNRKEKEFILLIDSHAHLGDEKLFSDWKELLKRAETAGLEAIVNICTDVITLERGLLIQSSNPSIPVFLAAATTPHDVETEGDLFFPYVEEAILQKKLVAIGETGLDYHYEHSPKETQKRHLIRYFELAKLSRIPLVFHCREAFQDLFDLADVYYKDFPGLVHCFTGSLEEAKEALKRGWNLSFSGIVTFKKSIELQEVLKYTPLDRIFVETDSPYLAPQTKRGLCNEPSFLVETVDCIARLKNISIEEVARVTSQNSRSFFGLFKNR